jgi:subtilisin family serine protease
METVVVLRDPGRVTRGDYARGAIGIRSRRRSSASIPQIDVERVDRRGLSELLQEPDVAAVSPVMPTRLIEPRAAQVEPREAAVAWGIEAVGAAESRYSGQGVAVAVLDTGIDADHPAFDGVTVSERNFTRSGAADVRGHGTHCAGTVLGRDIDGVRIGVAPGASRLLAGKVLGDDDSGSSDMLFEGVMWALSERADVISLSLGLDFPGMMQNLTAEGWPVALATSRALEAYGANLRLFDRLMDLARARSAFGASAVVVAAAGNESRRDHDPAFTIAASLPAAATGVLSVGAAARGDGLLGIGAFSNSLPAVCGPGVDVVSAAPGGGLVALTGTSMACPHVAGVAALWWEAVRAQGLPASAETVAAKLLAAARVDVFEKSLSAADRGVGLVTAP